MAGSLDSVRFAVELSTEQMVGAADAGAEAGQRLRQSIDDEQASVKELQKALRNISGGGKQFGKEQSDLKDKIAAGKIRIAQQEVAFQKMGFAGREATKAVLGAAQAEKKLESATKSAAKATASAGDSQGKLKGFPHGKPGPDW